MTRLIICRHADPRTYAESDGLARAFAATAVDALYTSPLERAVKTAAAISESTGLTPIEVPDLREIDLGEVEGVPFDRLPPELQTELLADPTAVRFPGGETFAELQQRVVGSFAAIVANHPAATVVVVAHAGVIRAALGAWLLADDKAVFRIDQKHGAVNIVDWDDGVPFVRVVNGC